MRQLCCLFWVGRLRLEWRRCRSERIESLCSWTVVASVSFNFLPLLPSDPNLIKIIIIMIL